MKPRKKSKASRSVPPRRPPTAVGAAPDGDGGGDDPRKISMEHGFPFASLENRILKVEEGQDLETVISERLARENLIVPLFLDGNTLAVAFAEPRDAEAVESLKRTTGFDIQPFVSYPGEIRRAITEFYRKK